MKDGYEDSNSERLVTIYWRHGRDYHYYYYYYTIAITIFMSALQLYLTRSENHLVQWKDLISISLFHLIPGSFLICMDNNTTRRSFCRRHHALCFHTFAFSYSFPSNYISVSLLVHLKSRYSSFMIHLKCHFKCEILILFSSDELVVLSFHPYFNRNAGLSFSFDFPLSPLCCKLLESIVHGLFMPAFFCLATYWAHDMFVTWHVLFCLS